MARTAGVRTRHHVVQEHKHVILASPENDHRFSWVTCHVSRVGSGLGDPTRSVGLENFLIRPDPSLPVRFRTPPGPDHTRPARFQ